MIVPLPGESAHSFILRHHIIYGVCDISNIVGCSGRWIHTPGVLRSTLYWYEPFSEHSLYLLVKNSGIAKPSTTVFSDPRLITRGLSDVFYTARSTAKKFGDYPIAFCPTCIQEQIKQYGAAYFKYDWLVDRKCRIHNEALLVKVLLKRNHYAELRAVLAGSFLGSKKLGSLVCDRPALPCQSDENVFSLKAAPCLAQSLLKWIRRRLHLLTEELAEASGYRSLNALSSHFIHVDGRFKDTHPVHLGNLLKGLFTVKRDTFNSFIECYGKCIELRFGVREKACISAPFWVDSSRCCQRCVERRCPNSSLIFSTKIQQVNVHAELPICDTTLIQEHAKKSPLI
ncbi:hypothetical protein VV869_10600 [Photobacterium sp. MCCC 1A19761]|uniref:hypothetical protein n=1 Tax=Photobacterium sp. MCCC 1A19761 TaxID=3115000 RepID=UPI00307F84F8